MTGRRVGITAIGALAALVFLGLPAPAQRTVVFERVSTLPSPLLKMFVHLGVEVPDPSVEYPASFFSTFDTGCSATLVGADSVLTAQHCAKYDAHPTLRIDGTDVQSTCTPSQFADIALCQLSTKLSGIVFDVIERDPATAAVGRTVRLTGWADPPPPNFLAAWLRRLRRRLGFGSPFKVGDGTVQQSGLTLMVLGATTNGDAVVLEPGDSGGAAYAQQGSKRTIVGVNMCGRQYCGNAATPATSELTNVTNQSVAEWIAKWAHRNGAQVCGFTSTVGCRP